MSIKLRILEEFYIFTKHIFILMLVFCILVLVNNNVFCEENTNIVDIDAGGGHTLVLKSDGTVWGAGDNYLKQLGTDERTIYCKPIKINYLSNIVEIKSGTLHNLALKKDGTVWGWGYNNKGELGNDYKNTKTIRQVENIKSISASVNTSSAVGTDGSVWTWGSNQLIESDYMNFTCIPEKHANIPSIGKMQLSQTYNFRIALDNSGNVWTVGYNGKGQLCNGTTLNTSIFKISNY